MYFFYRSKSCKQEGHILLAGHYKYSEQKREHGVLHKNIDLISIENREAALLHLTPSGAGYKVFPRKLPESFMPISYFYDIG